MFLAVFFVFIATGLRFSAASMALIAILVILNLGYSVSAIGFFEKQEVLYWI